MLCNPFHRLLLMSLKNNQVFEAWFLPPLPCYTRQCETKCSVPLTGCDIPTVCHQCWAKKGHLPQPAGSVFPNATEDSVDHLCSGAPVGLWWACYHLPATIGPSFSVSWIPVCVDAWLIDALYIFLSKNRFSLLNFHWCAEFTGKKYTKFHPLLCHNEHLKIKFVVMHIMMLLSSHWYYYTLICLHIQISVFFLLIFYFLWQCLHINISVAFIGVLFFFI